MVERAARQVPEIDGNPTYIDLTFKWIDRVGDTRSDVLRVDPKATDAQIEEAVARILVPASASLWQVRVAYVYAGEKSKNNAWALKGFQVQKALVFHAKNAQHESRRSFLPGIHESYLHPGSEMPIADHIGLVSWMDAVIALLAGTFSPVSLRFTQRRDIGKKKDL